MFSTKNNFLAFMPLNGYGTHRELIKHDRKLGLTL